VLAEASARAAEASLAVAVISHRLGVPESPAAAFVVPGSASVSWSRPQGTTGICGGGSFMTAPSTAGRSWTRGLVRLVECRDPALAMLFANDRRTARCCTVTSNDPVELRDAYETGRRGEVRVFVAKHATDRVTCGQRDAVVRVRAPVDGALSSHSALPRGVPRSRGAARHGGGLVGAPGPGAER
jgi:hypothetical protein